MSLFNPRSQDKDAEEQLHALTLTLTDPDVLKDLVLQLCTHAVYEQTVYPRSLSRFLREKRLSNAQVRGLCEANTGPAPRRIVY